MTGTDGNQKNKIDVEKMFWNDMNENPTHNSTGNITTLFVLLILILVDPIY